jgi:hypothetical protein
VADLRISELPPLSGADLAATDLVPIADLSASETKKLTGKELIQNGVVLIDDGTIPGAKLVPDSVTALELAPDSVTASELADGSVDTAAVMDLAITNSKIAPGVDGAKLTNDTVTAAKIPASSLDRGLDKSSGAIGHTNVIAPATRSGITFDAQGHITATAFLAPTDLPIATTTAVGAVSIPADSGLTVTAAGAVDHANNISAGSVSGITYDEHGHVVTAVPLVGADLPPATEISLGAVMVPQGDALFVDGNGVLKHADSPIAPGVYPKVTVDQNGHVTAGAVLAAADIPSLDASKIVSGTLSTALLADHSVTAQKLADYSTALIQETVPSAGVGSHPIGMIWLQESTGQVSVWNGNSWMKTGASTLFNRNLRYAGSYNPSTGLITGVTQFGTAEGFKTTDPIPAADDKIAGVYFVASGAGSSASVAGGATFDPGDWLLCHGTTGGWVRIDTLSGAGGGGGGGTTVSNLDDLLDVTLTAPTQGDFLQLGGASQWVNVSVLDEGTWT